jgi:hypothetical protein
MIDQTKEGSGVSKKKKRDVVVTTDEYPQIF